MSGSSAVRPLLLWKDPSSMGPPAFCGAPILGFAPAAARSAVLELCRLVLDASRLHWARV